ncbi:MAG: FtsQ-type POTRA domain-containing protein [Puniceicoccales bacterium]|jgi:cell division septal protein FtsQ|nr:FtsQ-type POTRA domain-containing protein [Puniceicoccales bacterium]
MTLRGKDHSWRSLQQDAQLTKARCKGFLSKFFILVAASFLCVIAFRGCAHFHKPLLCPQPLRKVTFTSDGVLSENWVKRHVSIPLGKDLMRIDLGYIKTQLEAYSQVASAIITRKFPDTLAIEIKEFKPMAKLLVSTQGKRCIRLISAEGKLFTPIAYTKHGIKTLPTLSDVTGPLIQERKILKFNKIYKLLVELMRQYPDVYATIVQISLKNFDPLLEEKWLQVDLRTSYNQHLIFNCTQIDVQMRKLKGILYALTPQQRSQLLRIDLSLTNPVVAFR